MRLTILLSCLLAAPATSSFVRDVVQKQAQLPLKGEDSVEDLLLEKAIPLAEYEAQVRSLRQKDPSSATRQMEDNADDYFDYDEDLYSFSGFSMKYSKCQPVQRFSEEAIQSGEYSPMITEDIIILRLCPTSGCYESEQYGCHYNYAEYAIGISEYVKIMVKYQMDERGRLCQWCANCGYGYQYNNNNGRKLEEDNGQEDEEEEEDEEANENNQNDAYYGNYQDGSSACSTYGSYCSNYYNDCVYYDPYGNNNAAQYMDDEYKRIQYLDQSDYADYVGCAEFEDKWGDIYFTRPMCDASDNSIKMGIFYDAYCTNFAGDDVTTSSFNVAFNDTALAFLYDGTCIDCSESNYPPRFVSSSYMCNKIRQKGAQCTQSMEYNLFGNQQYDSSECSFIESLRFGTYDKNGEITVHASEEQPETVTDIQKIGLVGTAVICAFFIIYACYIHHAMTNLLIKSLSHRELLPPSRHTKRKITARPTVPRGGSRGKGKSTEDDDWDRDVRVA